MNKTTESCDSSVLHWESCTAHKNHVIGRISALVFREHGVAFQQMDQAKSYGDLYFSLNNFGVQILFLFILDE